MKSRKNLLELAKRYFISDAGLSKANPIRKIQLAEGLLDCYATGKSGCNKTACRWRPDYLPKSANNANSLKPDVSIRGVMW